jgi:hypothetical protein
VIIFHARRSLQTATDAAHPVASPAGLGGQSGTDRPAALRESVFNPAQGLKVFRAK